MVLQTGTIKIGPKLQVRKHLRTDKLDGIEVSWRETIRLVKVTKFARQWIPNS